MLPIILGIGAAIVAAVALSDDSDSSSSPSTARDDSRERRTQALREEALREARQRLRVLGETNGIGLDDDLIDAIVAEMAGGRQGSAREQLAGAVARAALSREEDGRQVDLGIERSGLLAASLELAAIGLASHGLAGE